MLMQEQVISINPNVMSGVPVFAGTRVPIYSLFDYVLTGETIDAFINDFPTVSKEQAMKVITMAQEILLANSKFILRENFTFRREYSQTT
ncbi:DUF433 domain-containing protein [Thermoflexibacter ruber]|nr:DUF433 domain-containing protein [Thermoflexibacter ruber]